MAANSASMVAHPTSTTVVILAGGAATRWVDSCPKGYDTPKHLVQVPYRGRRLPLLARTIDLLRTYLGGHTTFNVVRPKNDARYEVVSGVSYRESQWTVHSDGIEPWLSWRTLWNRNGRTLVLLGDVWFSTEAIRRIAQPREVFTYYARTGPSEVTGCPWGEDFGVSFGPGMHRSWARALRTARRHRERVGRAGSWEAAQVLWGLDPERLSVPPDMDLLRKPPLPCHLEDMPDDGTDDFDYYADYLNWLQARTTS